MQENAGYEQRVEDAVKECRFAKQVITKDGCAILINGTVLSVESGSSDAFWVDVLTRALRRSGHIGCAEAGSVGVVE